MRDLPPELWLRFIESLRRPLPSPDTRQVEWHDLHQQDLTVAMRVNKMFNNLAGPVLYSKIVVDNPTALFIGVDAPIKPSQDVDTPDAAPDKAEAHQSQDPGPLHKRQLLRTVTALHVVAKWEKDSGPVSLRSAPAAPIAPCMPPSFATTLEPSPVDKLFPLLERRTYCLWDIRFPAPSQGAWAFEELLMGEEYELVFRGYQTDLPSARFICHRSRAGTYQPGSHTGMTTGSRVELQCLHDRNLYDFRRCFSSLLSPGSQTHAFFRSGDLRISVSEQLAGEDFSSLAGSLGSARIWWKNGNVDENLAARTRLYVLFPRPTRSADNSRSFDAKEELSRLTARLRAALEVTAPGGQLGSYTPDELMQHIIFDWADTKPTCKACGRSSLPADAKNEGWRWLGSST